MSTKNRLTSTTMMRGSVVAVALIGAAALGLAPASAESSSPAASAMPSPAPVPAKWSALVASDQPKQITLDSSTGAVLDAQTVSASVASPQLVTVHNPCQTGDACWTTSQTPYAIYGFAGTGTVGGSWVYRASFYTHAHSASVCWTYFGTHCSPAAGKNSVITFSTNGFTGIQETNYN